MNLNVSAAPHIRSKDTTSKIMLDVLIALVPALIAAVILFGFRAIVLTAISAAACVVFEALMCLVMRRKMTVGDLTAVVTGVLLAFSLPVSCPYWVVIVGDAFAIIVVKGLVGGLGQNIFNPALGGRAFMMLLWPSRGHPLHHRHRLRGRLRRRRHRRQRHPDADHVPWVPCPPTPASSTCSSASTAAASARSAPSRC